MRRFLGNGKNKIVVQNGKIIKVIKDKDGICTKRSPHEEMDRLDRLLERRF